MRCRCKPGIYAGNTFDFNIIHHERGATVSTFINSAITNSGRLLIAKSYLGERMNFTRIVMGDGYLPEGISPRDMTDVVHAVVVVPITKMKINADETVIIGGVFSNADIQTEFFYRELALFAEGADGVEVLYCYGNAGDFAERITPMGGSAVIEKAIDIVTAIGTTDNVTATIIRTTTADAIAYNDSISGLGAESLQEAIEILARSGSDVLNIHMADTDAHGIRESLAAHNNSAESHTDLRVLLAELKSKVQRMEDMLVYNITGNPFMVTFEDLTGVVVSGVWNQTMARVEF